MTLTEYQKQAHTTAVYGNNMAYPIAALAEETGEVLRVYGGYAKDAPYRKADWDVTKAKLRDELGDVLWNVAEMCTLLDINLEGLWKDVSRIVESDAAKKEELQSDWMSNDLTVLMCNLVTAIGKINGTWAKYIRKHNGEVPKVEAVLWTYKNDMADPAGERDDGSIEHLGCRLQIDLFFIALSLLVVLRKCSLSVEEIMGQNIAKLAARQQNNTLGGTGSVERAVEGGVEAKGA